MDTFARDSRFTPEGISRSCRKIAWTPHNPYMTLNPGQVLRVVVALGLHRGRLQDAYNALRGRNPRTREIEPEQRERELEKLKAGQIHVLRPLNWDEFLKVLERAGFRSHDMITSQNTVLYTYALWLMGRVEFNVPVDELREVMARWFFMSQITGRYTNSPETRIQEDISRIDGLAAGQAAFIGALNEQIESAVPPDWWTATLPDNLYTSSTNAPAYVAYIAALSILDSDVLLSTLKVKDWLSPSRRTVKGIEKHHLFPKDYLKTKLGLTSTKKINQVANFALVEWSDNIGISNDPPERYWPEQVVGKNMEDDRRRRQEEWHALPDGWTSMDYNGFLSARRRLMAQVTYEGFKRLTDPNYVPDLVRPPAEPTAAELVLPSLADLVISGILPAGSQLRRSMQRVSSSERSPRMANLWSASMPIAARTGQHMKTALTRGTDGTIGSPISAANRFRSRNCVREHTRDESTLRLVPACSWKCGVGLAALVASKTVRAPPVDPAIPSGPIVRYASAESMT